MRSLYSRRRARRVECVSGRSIYMERSMCTQPDHVIDIAARYTACIIPLSISVYTSTCRYGSFDDTVPSPEHSEQWPSQEHTKNYNLPPLHPHPPLPQPISSSHQSVSHQTRHPTSHARKQPDFKTPYSPSQTSSPKPAAETPPPRPTGKNPTRPHHPRS